MVYPPSSSHSNVHYEPLPYDDPDPQDEPEGQAYTDDAPPYQDDADIDLEANETSSLVPRLHPAPHTRHQRQGSSSTKGLLSNLGINMFASTSNQASASQSLRVTPLSSRVTTPLSSDGVFTNIPAKPTSSRDVNKEDEEMGEDEWIFMTPEQRKKLPPPKYSRVKRDRAPKYTPTYNPPALPTSRSRSRIKSPRGPRPIHARINTNPSGSPSHFIITCLLSIILPLIGFIASYIASRGLIRRRWKTHAARLGSKAGFGVGLFHVGAMILYIPALVQLASTGNRPPLIIKSFPHNLPLLLSLLFTFLVSIPIGFPLAHSSMKSYLWIRAEERVLKQRLVSSGIPNIAVADAEEESSDEGEAMEREDGRDGYMYIEGTDLRLKDLKRILARARDARLARSLRAAGF